MKGGMTDADQVLAGVLLHLHSIKDTQILVTLSSVPHSRTLLLPYRALITDQRFSINPYFFLLSDGLAICFIGLRGQENVIC